MRRLAVHILLLAGLAMIATACLSNGPNPFGSSGGYTACMGSVVDVAGKPSSQWLAAGSTAVKQGGCTGSEATALLHANSRLWRDNGNVVFTLCGTGNGITKTSTGITDTTPNEFCVTGGSFISQTYHEAWITGTKYTGNQDSGWEDN